MQPTLRIAKKKQSDEKDRSVLTGSSVHSLLNPCNMLDLALSPSTPSSKLAPLHHPQYPTHPSTPPPIFLDNLCMGRQVGGEVGRRTAGIELAYGLGWGMPEPRTLGMDLLRALACLSLREDWTPDIPNCVRELKHENKKYLKKNADKSTNTANKFPKQPLNQYFCCSQFQSQCHSKPS